MEAELSADLPWRLGLELAAHQLGGRAVDDGAPLDAIPVPTLTARLRKDAGRWNAWVRGAFFGALDEPGPTEQERPGYSLLDAGIGVRAGSRLEVDLLGRNLLDEAYLATPDARATLAPGITGILTATFRF